MRIYELKEMNGERVNGIYGLKLNFTGGARKFFSRNESIFQGFSTLFIKSCGMKRKLEICLMYN